MRMRVLVEKLRVENKNEISEGKNENENLEFFKNEGLIKSESAIFYDY